MSTPVNPLFPGKHFIGTVLGALDAKVEMSGEMTRRYLQRAAMAGIIIGLFYATSYAVVAAFEAVSVGASTLEPIGRIAGALTFGWALVFIHYSKSELLTSNMMIVSIGGYHRRTSWQRALRLLGLCYLGNAIGAVVYAPFLVFWLTPTPPAWRGRRPFEQAAVALAVGLLGWVTLERPPAAVEGPSIAFLGFPLVVWAAFRLGQRETATCVVLLSAIALWGTFAPGAPANEVVLLVQSFAAVLAITGAAVAALAFQHRQLQVDLEDRVALRTTELARSNAALHREMDQREAVDQALRASEQRLLEAQAVAHIGSWEWDIGHNTVWWSDELCRIYGTPGSTPSYEEFLARVHPEDRAEVEAIVRRAFEDHAPFV